MTQQHPITPPPELVEKWGEDWYRSKVKHTDLQSYIVAKAVQWGADTELEACCEIALKDPVCGTKHQRRMLVQHMRERCRFKSPSLKERIAAEIENGTACDRESERITRDVIREVAAWLIDRKRDDDWLAPFEEVANLLLEEVQR